MLKCLLWVCCMVGSGELLSAAAGCLWQGYHPRSRILREKAHLKQEFDCTARLRMNEQCLPIPSRFDHSSAHQNFHWPQWKLIHKAQTKINWLSFINYHSMSLMKNWKKKFEKFEKGKQMERDSFFTTAPKNGHALFASTTEAALAPLQLCEPDKIWVNPWAKAKIALEGMLLP